MLLALSVLIFILLRLTPGDPIDAYIDPNVAISQEEMAALRARLGLDQPLPVQYFAWLSQAVQGNLGYSIQRFDQTVAGLIAQRMGPTLLLMGNEQQGLPDTLADACDTLLRIPQAGRADSLNLAVATGVMLFEIRRDALKLEPGPSA